VSRTRARAVAVALALALLASGCVRTVHPLERPNTRALAPTRFSHEPLDRVLARFVDGAGLVDYRGLGREPFVLGSYVGQLAAWSPDSHPELFPDGASRLAYWINAYNAVALRLILEFGPTRSVLDAGGTWWTPLLPEGAGFFLATRMPLGGRAMSLHGLENRILRRRFDEPRIHFALVCAARGCPALPRDAYDPARLDAQLAEATRRFLDTPRGFRIDPEARTAWLSRIFEWHADDFTEGRPGGRDAALLAFVAEHAGPRVATAADGAAREAYAVRFLPWDWRLNARALGPRTAPVPPGARDGS